MSRAFITGRVAIDSMRDNGYKNTAYAVAELIDNSIQAGANRVDLICLENDSPSSTTGRRIKKVDEVIILDNGSGMSPETLHFALEFGASQNREDSEGMGKFGMGLPNSSISQCKRVEVWSWTTPGEYNFTYLDIDEMKDGSLEVIPEVCFNTIPNDVINALPEGIPNTGTLIKWSKLDRMVWSTSKSIQRHSEDLVGRMYRHFISKGTANIWFHSKVKGDDSNQLSEKFKSNDPLYLSRNTSLPDLPFMYKDETFFEAIDPTEVPINFDGKDYIVKISTSVVKKNVFDYIRAHKGQKVGMTEWGKHCSKNFGVSVVRSDRELELIKDFIPYKLRDTGRFMGVEVSFPPGLDIVFGVTNNKQHAVNFVPMDLEEDAEKEGYVDSATYGTAVEQYRKELILNNDYKLLMYKVIKEVENSIKKISDEYMNKLNFGNIQKEGNQSSILAIAKTVTEVTNERIDKGHGVQSDDEVATFDSAKSLFIEHGDTPQEAEAKATIVIEENLKFFIETKELIGDVFFEVSQKSGLSLLYINEKHPFFENIMTEVEEKEQNMLVLTLAAWARMENEASAKNKDKLRSYRMRWGEMLGDYLPEPIS